MTDKINNLLGTNEDDDDIIDQKKIEKNMEVPGTYKKEDVDKPSVPGRIFNAIFTLAKIIFILLFVFLITSNFIFLVTCGRSIVNIGKDGKKRSFNDIWFPSYYFFEESDRNYPFCQDMKLGNNGMFKNRENFLRWFDFEISLPFSKYRFDFFTWWTAISKSWFYQLLQHYYRFFLAVINKTNVINNARILDLLQIIEYLMPLNPYFRNLLLFVIGIPLIFLILLLSSFSGTFVFLFNLHTTDTPYNWYYLIFMATAMLVILNLSFPMIFMVPFELLLFPITFIIYFGLIIFAIISMSTTMALAHSLLFNAHALLKLMFVGYFAGGYRAISRNAQENKHIYMFLVGLTLLITIILNVI